MSVFLAEVAKYSPNIFERFAGRLDRALRDIVPIDVRKVSMLHYFSSTSFTRAKTLPWIALQQSPQDVCTCSRQCVRILGLLGQDSVVEFICSLA
jgi:hypothetical protein